MSPQPPIRQTVLTVGGAEPGPLMVVSGGVHGDEWEGPLAVIRLFKELTPRSLQGTFVGLVVANVPAFDAAIHNSPIDGLSLNSVFPGDPEGSITRQIAYWMGQRFIGPSDFYVDFIPAVATSRSPPWACTSRAPGEPPN